MSIREEMLAVAETGYAAFQAKLAPAIERERFLGVRVPELRRIEKEYRGTEEGEAFLRSLPHVYYDEDLLHSIFLSHRKDFGRLMEEVELFLPHVDNWAVCDTLRPPVFGKHREEVMERIPGWISSSAPFTCRFGIEMLMLWFLEEDFREEYLELPAAVCSKEYYVNMMIAWFYAEALVKQWDAALPYLQQHRLEPWIHNKTIQKACESYRIPPERKEYLRSLKK